MQTRFISTSEFDRQWKKLGATNSDYLELTEYISARGPETLTRVSKFTRIVRAKVGGRGKSGGARVILFAEIKDTVFLISCYDRRRQSGLSRKEKQEIDDLCRSLMK